MHLSSVAEACICKGIFCAASEQDHRFAGAGKEGLPKGSTVHEDGSALLPSNAAILPNGSVHADKPTNGQKPASNKVRKEQSSAAASLVLTWEAEPCWL